MENKKIKSGFTTLMIFMVICFVVGTVVSIFVFKMDLEGIKNAFIELGSLIVSYSFFIQILIFVSTIIPGFIYYKKAVDAIKVPGKDDDDEDKEQKIDITQTKSLYYSSIGSILAFMIYGLSVNVNNSFIIPSVVVFLATMISSFWLDSHIVKQVKILQGKKGDITKLNFKSEWVESFDEAEKYQLYKASYNASKISGGFTAILFYILFFGKVFFETSGLAMLIVGLIWLVHTVTFFFFSNKK